jgi:thymidylate synthase ThyX
MHANLPAAITQRGDQGDAFGPCGECPACGRHDAQGTLVLCPKCQAWLQWGAGVRAAETAYLNLLADGIRPEIARSVLPTCLSTQIVCTANFREWLHILSLRTAPAAHPQMREVMAQAQAILAGVCQEVFA